MPTQKSNTKVVTGIVRLSYYTRYIQGNAEWEFVSVYTDATVIIGLNQQSLGVQGVAPV